MTAATILTCWMCGSWFTLDPDREPVAFDRETREPAPVCVTCDEAVRRVVGP